MTSPTVGPMPPPPQDWTLSTRGCGCGDCDQLDSFLTDPSKRSGSIPVSNAERAHHLERRLETVGSDWQAQRTSDNPRYKVLIDKTRRQWFQAVMEWEKTKRGARRKLREAFEEKELGRSLCSGCSCCGLLIVAMEFLLNTFPTPPQACWPTTYL